MLRIMTLLGLVVLGATAACYGGESTRIATLEQRLATLERSPVAAPPPPVVSPAAPATSRKSLVAADTMYGGHAYGGATYGSVTMRIEDLEIALGALERKVDELERRLSVLDAAEEAKLLGGPMADLFAVTGIKTRPTSGVEYAVPLADSPRQGSADAPVTWVVGIELSEPFSFRLLSVVRELRQTYGDRLRVVYKHFVVHTNYGGPQALAWCAAARQGKLDAAIDDLRRHHETARGVRASDYRMAVLRPRMQALGLDMRKFDRDVAGPCRKDVQRDQALFASLGNAGTPMSYVNGHYFSGAQSKETFQRAIEEALSRASSELGTKSARGYYDRIVKRGRTAP
jgi:hypothetical protein